MDKAEIKKAILELAAKIRAEQSRLDEEAAQIRTRRGQLGAKLADLTAAARAFGVALPDKAKRRGRPPAQGIVTAGGDALAAPGGAQRRVEPDPEGDAPTLSPPVNPAEQETERE